MHVKLIAIVGAESTGKTTLCAQLARALNGLWVPEYLRTLCELQGRVPLASEQRAVMQQQMENETIALHAARSLGLSYVLCDSTPLMTAIYSELLFHDTSLYEAAFAYHHKHYALTLFMQPDMGWVHDGMRDGAHVQPPVTALLEKQLKAHAVPYVRISGAGNVRFENALAQARMLST
jgi:nicotinamide riboside kinase